MGKIKLFFDIISFNTPVAKSINITGIFSIFAVIPERMISYSPFKCVFKYLVFPVFSNSCTGYGCSCPGCGLTRGMWKLIHGDISGAVKMNVLTPLVLSLMIGVLVISLYSISKSYLSWKTKK